MTAAVAPLARQVAARAQRDARFARVLDALLAAPTTPQGTLERVTAQKLNSQRRAALVQDFVDGSMRTPDVQALLGKSADSDFLREMIGFTAQRLFSSRARRFMVSSVIVGSLVGVEVRNQTLPKTRDDHRCG